MLVNLLRVAPLICCCAILVSPSLAAAQGPAPGYVAGELIVKIRDTQRDQLAIREGRPAQDRSARLQFLRDRFGFREARSLRGMPRKLSQGQRARLAARSARAGRPPALQAAEKALAEFSRVYVVKLPEGGDVERAVALLSADPAVEWAQPNYIMEANQYVPNDPFWPTSGSWGQSEDDLWGLKRIEADYAWDDPDGKGAGAVVAVVDTGVDFSHPDLAANAWVNPGEIPGNGTDDDGNGYIDDVNGFDFWGSDPDPTDEHGHGTHVAGTIAAVGDNGIGVIGVAFEAQIMGVRGLGPNGSGTTEDLAAGIVYAAVNGADVINNSWGCSIACPSDPVVEETVREAHDIWDAVVVFAAGNSSDNVVLRSPGNMSETITVSALTPTDEATAFTCFGPLVDVGAPGGGPGALTYTCEPDGFRNILSLQVSESVLDLKYPGCEVAPGYFRLAGTSMAAPHVSGVAALLRAHDPTLSNEQVRQILRLASDPIATSDPFLGHGRVNARKALESTLDVELLIETPDVGSRTLEEPLEVHGYARGTNLQHVQVSVGPGMDPDPTLFAAMPTTWDPITGEVTATVDVSDFPDGYALLRLEADDGSQTYSSGTGVLVDNVEILSPTWAEVVQGQIDVVVDVGTSPFLERVVVTYFNHFTNQTETLLDETEIPGPVLTIPFDTTTSIDSTYLDAVQPVILVETHFDVNGESVVTTEYVFFKIDNDRITSPPRGSITNDPSPFNVEGTALHDVQLQVHDGSGWVTEASIPAGSFSVPVDPAARVDLEAQNLVVVRLLADIDGDEVFSESEQNEFVNLYVDTGLSSAWPQQGDEPAWHLGVTVGDLDGDGVDEVVATPSGDKFYPAPLPGLFDPDQGILVYDGSGTLNTAIQMGSKQFQEPGCGSQAALHDLDGLPGLELIWTGWGQIAALRHDGTPPAGFAPDVFNDGDVYDEFGSYDFLPHWDADYTEMFPCRPATPFTTHDGDLRIVQGTRLFDMLAWATELLPSGIPRQFLKSKVLLFDATGALVNEEDRGPGLIHGPVWAVGDVGFDTNQDIVTTRSELPGPNGEKDSTLLVYDALTLELEVEVTLNQVQLGAPILADLDGDNGQLTREVLVQGLQLPPVGESGTATPALFAFYSNGDPVPGFPYTTSGGRPTATMAVADLDSDGAHEIVLVQKNDQLKDELVLLDYDSATQQLQVAPGAWPVAMPGQVKTILLADIDGDQAPEVIYGSYNPWTYSVGTKESRIFDDPFVAALELDGTPWRGGWKRSLRGRAPYSIAIGNIDSGPEPELVVGYPVRWVAYEDPLYFLPEVLAYSLDGTFSPATAPWSHGYGNAQHSAAPPTQCQDGVDNDNDGQIDNLDPECTGPLDAVEACGLGPELVLLLPPLYWLSRRRQLRRDR